MFSWYRRSVLTVVHLSDVSDTGTLTSSEGFKRGWTLQELLAPRTLLIFTQDWALYRGISSNHKKDSAILEELEKATGITAGYLADFRPDVDDARRTIKASVGIDTSYYSAGRHRLFLARCLRMDCNPI